MVWLSLIWFKPFFQQWQLCHRWIIASGFVKINNSLVLCPDNSHSYFLILLYKDRGILHQQLDFILVAFCSKQQKTEIAIVTMFGFSNWYRVKHLPKQINKPNISYAVGVTSQSCCVVFLFCLYLQMLVVGEVGEKKKNCENLRSWFDFLNQNWKPKLITMKLPQNYHELDEWESSRSSLWSIFDLELKAWQSQSKKWKKYQ